jgi:F0F1-type ATP synthase membrane subunit a
MKLPTIKRKTRLLVWMIFCFIGLAMNIWGFVYYIRAEDNWRIFRTGIWILLFTIALVSTYIKYKKQLQAESNS